MLSILIHSPAFYPSVGGYEFMARMLAEELAALGHRVTVVTKTKSVGEEESAFKVLRTPGPLSFLYALRSADVVLHMNLSLKALWPLTLVRRPLVIAHHGRYRRADGRIGLRDRLKYRVSRIAANIAVSEAVKDDLPHRSVVIGSAYDSSLFFPLPGRRDRDLVFVARLVSEKGADILLSALAALSACGVRPTLTIVGSGPEEPRLRSMSEEHGLSDRVEFVGQRTGRELAALINRHVAMVVPSRNEGFGIAALEGIACGCIVVASDVGGLPRTVGACGLTFRSGDVPGLARTLKRALEDETLRKRLGAGRERHLARFARAAVARRYLEVLEDAVAGARRG